MNKGMVHIQCGDGKGKTTASVGLAARASGSGMKVLFCQFLKNPNSSELKSLGLLPGVTLLHGKVPAKFTFLMNEKELAECAADCLSLLNEAAKICAEKDIDLLVLDESVGACNAGVLDENALAEFLKNKPEKLEVMLTGRDPSERLCGLADYISEVRKIKHPFDKGVNARRGIEF